MKLLASKRLTCRLAPHPRNRQTHQIRYLRRLRLKEVARDRFGHLLRAPVRPKHRLHPPIARIDLVRGWCRRAKLAGTKLAVHDR